MEYKQIDTSNPPDGVIDQYTYQCSDSYYFSSYGSLTGVDFDEDSGKMFVSYQDRFSYTRHLLEVDQTNPTSVNTTWLAWFSIGIQLYEHLNCWQPKLRFGC